MWGFQDSTPSGDPEEQDKASGEEATVASPARALTLDVLQHHAGLHGRYLMQTDANCLGVQPPGDALEWDDLSQEGQRAQVRTSTETDQIAQPTATATTSCMECDIGARASRGCVAGWTRTETVLRAVRPLHSPCSTPPRASTAARSS